MKTKRSSSFFVLIFCRAYVALSFSLFSCNITPGIIPAEKESVLFTQVKKKSYVALIEGMQPLSGESMGLLEQRLSSVRGLSVCATSGNHDAHMPVIREAHKNHQKIYIAGFSVGEAEAISLAGDCQKEGIPVEKLFLLDGVKKVKIPRAVKSAVDIVGTSPWMFRRSTRYSGSDFEDLKTSISYYKVNGGHLGVPAQSYDIMLSGFQ
ncbi:MAG: hypothetical protein WCJ74_01285 [bacterium]